MSVGPERIESKTWAARRGLVVFVAGVVLLAFAGLVLLLALLGGSAQVTVEVYNYHLFVRMRDPEPGAEIWVPVPDFSELRALTSVNKTFAGSLFPSRNVTQSIEESIHGTVFRFAFSEPLAVFGSIRVTPGSANGTLTFNSQVSNDVWIYLANVSTGNQVSIILYYEVAQIHGFLSRTQIIFLGTADPLENAGTQLVASPGYLGEMIRDDRAYTLLANGWVSYPLTTGGFAVSGD